MSEDYGIGSGAEGMKEAAVRGKQSFREQSAVVRDDLRELARTGGAAAREIATEARKAAVERVEQGKEKIAGARDQVVSYIEDRPVQSVLVALGAGVLVGFFLGRRR